VTVYVDDERHSFAVTLTGCISISPNRSASSSRQLAVETDRYGPLEHPARLAGDQAKRAQIARIRARAE
jgi:hypothetical protein